MPAQDALAQAKKAFSFITKQAGVAAAHALPGVSSAVNTFSTAQNVLNKANQAGFANTPLSQNMERIGTSAIHAASNLPDISSSVPGISHGFNYLKGLNQQLSQQGIPGRVASTVASLPLGIVEGVVNIPTDLIRGSTKVGTQVGNAGVGNPINWQSGFSGAGQLGKSFLNASMVPGNAGAAAAEAAPSSFLGAVKQGAQQGAKFGGEFGFAQGLQSHEHAKNLFDQFTGAGMEAAQNALAGGVLGGGMSGAGYGVKSVKGMVNRTQSAVLDKVLFESAGQQQAFQRNEGVQGRVQGKYDFKMPDAVEVSGRSGNKISPMREGIPTFQIKKPGTNQTQVVDAKQLLKIPEYQKFAIEPFNQAAQMIWRKNFSGGFINPGELLGGGKEAQPTELPVPQLPPELQQVSGENTKLPVEGADRSVGVGGASNYPSSGQEFERSLGVSSFPNPLTPNELNISQREVSPQQIQSPEIPGGMATPSDLPGNTLPLSGFQPQEKSFRPSADIPGVSSMGEGRETGISEQPALPELRAQSTSLEQNQLHVASDGTISSPSSQNQIDQIFSQAKLAKDTPLSKSNEFASAVKDIFDPVAGTVQGADIKNAFRNHRAIFDHAANLAQRDSLDLTKSWEKVPLPDHLKFIQGIELGSPIDIKGVDPGVAQKYQQRFADDYAIQKSIRPDAPYRENYFTQSGVWKDPKAAEQFYSKWQKGSLGGSKSFFEQRAFPTVLDGVKAGLELKETNPETLYLNNHTQVLKAKMADDFSKEMQSKGMPQDLVQKVIDRYMDPGIAGNPIYKTARSANAALNSSQLGLSAFHFTTTTMNSFTSKMAQGIEEMSQGRDPSRFLTGLKDVVSTPLAPFQQLLRGNKMLKEAFSNNPELSADIQNVITAGGKFSQDEAYKNGAWNSMMKNVREGKVIPAAAKAPFAALEKISSPLMDYYVPRLKLGAFADLASSKLASLGESATKEEQRAVLSQAWDSVDNRFGQLVQDNLFWNKTAKDVLNLSTRSLGWNIGTLREIGGGTLNAAKAPKQILSGKGIDSNTAYSLALPVMTGIAASVYSYLHGQTPQSLKDYFYPRTGEIKQPKPGSPDQNSYDERVSIPGYAKDVYAFAKNPVSTVINKTSPIVSLAAKAVELGQTGGIKDYFGNQVVDPNADPATKTGQLAKFGASQFLPFSVSGQNQRVGQDLGTKVESGFGFSPAPASITKGANADLMNQSYTQNLTTAQTAKAFELQKQGLDPQTYIQGVIQKRDQNKQDKVVGTDLDSQKIVAVQAFLQGDNSKAKDIGMTAQNVQSVITSQLRKGADALISGDETTAKKIEQQYGRAIPLTVKSSAAHARSITLLKTAMLYQQQGDPQSAKQLIDQAYQLKQQYPFRFSQQERVQVLGQ